MRERERGLTEADVPVTVLSLAEVLGQELAARGWTIEDAAARMDVDGPARDAFYLGLTIAVQADRLVLDDDFMGGLARAFDVSPDFFRNIHARWLAHPGARQPYEAPDSLSGPWLRRTLGRRDGMIGRTYYERGLPVVVLKRWRSAPGEGRGPCPVYFGGPACGTPRNVLIERADGTRVVRSFRGLRVAPSRGSDASA